MAELTLNVEITFKHGKRGAYLVMKRPRTTDLPKDVILANLSRVDALRQPGTLLVVGVVSCPAYTLEVSDKGTASHLCERMVLKTTIFCDVDGKKVRVQFLGQLPVPGTVGVTAGGGLNIGWNTEHAGSSHQHGCNKDGDDIYCPLYCLKQVRPPSKYRQAQPERQGDDTYVKLTLCLGPTNAVETVG